MEPYVKWIFFGQKVIFSVSDVSERFKESISRFPANFKKISEKVKVEFLTYHVTRPLIERFDPHPFYHHFVKASFNRSHHTRDSSLTVTPDMPHAKSAITHHFGIGIGLAFRHFGPALACALGCLRFYFCFAPAFPVFLPGCELFSR